MLDTRRQPQQPLTTCSTSSSIGLGIDVLSGVHRRLERGYLCRSASSCCAPHQVRKIPRRGVAGTVALVATVVTLTVATGGTALVAFSAVAEVANGVALAAGVMNTVDECSDGGAWQDCAMSARLTALPYGVGKLTEGLRGTTLISRHVADDSRSMARALAIDQETIGWGASAAAYCS